MIPIEKGFAGNRKPVDKYIYLFFSGTNHLNLNVSQAKSTSLSSGTAEKGIEPVLPNSNTDMGDKSLASHVIREWPKLLACER